MHRIDIPASLVEWIIALFKHRYLRVATAYRLSDGIQQTKDSGYEMKVTWPNDINDPITWTQYRLQVPICAYMDRVGKVSLGPVSVLGPIGLIMWT
ncbi:unnamed protein product [Rhizophagus irregularis]|nr:unnamed protein product [Rhizophagus irregularis]